MIRDELECAVLLADVSGTTSLYENSGNDAALMQVNACLDRLRSIITRERGEFISSKGDDVLCIFGDASAALRAARSMLAEGPAGAIAIHGGLHWGTVIRARDDIFGDTVNLVARFASKSNSGEFLVGQNFSDQISPAEQATLRPLNKMVFKGKAQPIDVYALLDQKNEHFTQISSILNRGNQSTGPPRQTSLRLSFAGRIWWVNEGEEISIGRSAECDLIFEDQRVSRHHAVFIVRPGLVEISDRSSTGSYLTIGGAPEFFVRRQTVLLSGSGIISPGIPAASAGACAINFTATICA